MINLVLNVLLGGVDEVGQGVRSQRPDPWELSDVVTLERLSSFGAWFQLEVPDKSPEGVRVAIFGLCQVLDQAGYISVGSISLIRLTVPCGGTLLHLREVAI